VGLVRQGRQACAPGGIVETLKGRTLMAQNENTPEPEEEQAALTNEPS
jgi:hypothetical protein